MPTALTRSPRKKEKRPAGLSADNDTQIRILSGRDVNLNQWTLKNTCITFDELQDHLWVPRKQSLISVHKTFEALLAKEICFCLVQIWCFNGSELKLTKETPVGGKFMLLVLEFLWKKIAIIWSWQHGSVLFDQICKGQQKRKQRMLKTWVSFEWKRNVLVL